MDLFTLINNLRLDGTLQQIANNPLVQFGTPGRRYIGAELLPEKTVLENAYREENIKFRTVIANSGTRYSPVQKKGADMVGSMSVELAESDIGREFTGRDYDTFLSLFGGGKTMEAALSLLQWVDINLVRSLVELNEKQKWDAIINAQVVRTGNNNYTETIQYSDPSGHRANAGGTWSSNSYDPYTDIVAMVNLLASKGYTVSRIITRRPVVSILAANEKMRQRVGLTTLSPGVLAGLNPAFLSIDAVNGVLSKDGLPPIEEYNLMYRTQTGTGYFLDGNTMVFVCTTGRTETIDLGDSVKEISDTLGYHAIGRPTGQPTTGKVIKLTPFDNKPPRIEGEGWQTALPVITEPEAIAVIKNIA